MVEGAKKHKKIKFSDDDAATLLRRYSATTVLSLLQEVAQVQDVKMDWKDLVKNSKTGITSAREYQMLWRHLAYRHALVERLDSGAESAECLDDDSDLECELVATPSVTSDASTEAAACVKVLIASGSQSETSLASGLTIEAPLLINIPTHQSSGAPTDLKLRRKNVTVPVSVQKITKSTVACPELDANGSMAGNRRKRKPWSESEDLELIAAVQKLGEGNWANIVKGDFKGERTPSQLSQRWQIIRKRNVPTSIGSIPHVSEAMLAARRAVNLAIDMPDNMTVGRPIASTSKSLVPINPTRHPAVDMPLAPAYQSQQPDFSAHLPSSKARPGGGKKLPTTKAVMTPDDMVKATAVAAGARIASPSDAASLLKAAHAKNAVHIMPGLGSLNKSSTVTNSLPPNVHFMRSAPITATRPIQQTQNGSSKPASQMVQTHSNRAALESQRSAELTTTGAPSVSASEPKVKASSNIGSSNPPKEQVKEDQAAAAAAVVGSVPSKSIVECADTVREVAMAEAPGSEQNKQTQEQAAAVDGGGGLPGETATGPAQEGQIASANPVSVHKHENDGGQERPRDSLNKEVSVGNGESVDVVMKDAEVEASEEPPKCG